MEESFYEITSNETRCTRNVHAFSFQIYVEWNYKIFSVIIGVNFIIC